MKKDTNIIIRVNSDLKIEALKLCRNNNVSISSLLSAYLEDAVKHNKIPLNILGRINYRKVSKNNRLEISNIKKCLDQIIKSQGKNDIKKAYLFGSYARGEASNDSDVDIRLEVGEKLSLIDISNIRLSLKEDLGKEIDLITQNPNELDVNFYNEIKKDEICLYEKR